MKTFKKHDSIPGDFKWYTKKPIAIKAVQMSEDFQVKTLEGTMIGRPGDYLIEGVQGEKYPCKKEIFEATYDKKTD